MKHSKKIALLSLVLAGALSNASLQSFADNTDPPRTGHITGRSVLAGVLSFVAWPGIGQAVNSDKGDKVLTHAVAGLFVPFRFWSGYDALVDRKGGYWNGKI